MLELRKILSRKCVVVCLGNIERGDDGVGPALAEALKGKAICKVIDAGIAPENYTGVIRQLEPESVVIVDAVYFEGKPGEIRLFLDRDIFSGKISTHNVSPRLLMEYLQSFTNAEIYLLGVRPKSNRFGERLTKELKSAVEKLEALFRRGRLYGKEEGFVS